MKFRIVLSILLSSAAAVGQPKATGIDSAAMRLKVTNGADPQPFLALAVTHYPEADSVFLIEKGADPVKEFKNKAGDPSTALHDAAYLNRKDIVAASLKLAWVKPDVKVEADKKGRGWTPLHSAAQGNAVDVAKLLLKANANVDEVSHLGETPLMVAARFGKIDVLELLLDEKADKTLKDDKGETALDIAEAELKRLLAIRVKPGDKVADVRARGELVKGLQKVIAKLKNAPVAPLVIPPRPPMPLPPGKIPPTPKRYGPGGKVNHIGGPATHGQF